MPIAILSFWIHPLVRCWESPHLFRHYSEFGKFKWSLVEWKYQYVAKDHINLLYLMDFGTLLAVLLSSQTSVLLFEILSCPFQPLFSWLLHLPQTFHQMFSLSFYHTLFQHEKSSAQIWHPLKTVSVDFSSVCISIHQLEAGLTAANLVNRVAKGKSHVCKNYLT